MRSPEAKPCPIWARRLRRWRPMVPGSNPMTRNLPADTAFPAGKSCLASHAVTTVVSPDHRTLLILTSGYNRVSNTHLVPVPPAPTWVASDSNEYVFIYDISIP